MKHARRELIASRRQDDKEDEDLRLAAGSSHRRPLHADVRSEEGTSACRRLSQPARVSLAKPAQPAQGGVALRGRHATASEEQAPGFETYERVNWKAPKKKGLSIGKKIAIGVACSLLAIIVVGVSAAALYVNSVNSKLKSGLDDEALIALEAPMSIDAPFYALILGSDTREEGATGRSDTIILARIDPSKQDVTLVSIPRDTRVQLPGYGAQKINAAYAYGGAAGSIKAVSEFAGVPISHVVEVDFSGFKEIVDALGGVTVDVPANTSYRGVNVPEGIQTLDGEQALVFARCRKTYAEGDYQRTANQRQLVQAITKEVLNAPVTEMPALIGSLTSAVSTDMSVDDLVSLAMQMRGMNVKDMKTAVVPSYSGMQDGISYVFAEEPAWSEMMARVDAGEDPNAEETGES